MLRVALGILGLEGRDQTSTNEDFDPLIEMLSHLDLAARQVGDAFEPGQLEPPVVELNGVVASDHPLEATGEDAVQIHAHDRQECRRRLGRRAGEVAVVLGR